ncbi:transposase [Paracoccus versutus]|uniref:Transposase n=1 Tax=Paracoccus versutus TaxID=34007 RepID=A0A3D9XU57_PARVE|nr:transposase [Paracoccus versutus]
MSVFATIMTELAAQAQETGIVMIDATHAKAHRTASSLAVQKGGRGRLIGRTKGGLNSKLHVLADAKGRPIRMFLSAGQTSDCIGVQALLSSIPRAGALLADRGYDAGWFRNALIRMGISPCIPSRIGRKVPIPYDADLYRQRHRIENMFARLKDWRRIATRYDRCPILFSQPARWLLP